jgi:3-hydroxyacyl-CoA dehydrogenase
MGLVEVGVGLIPAGGGTKEMLLKSTQELAGNPQNDLLPELRRAWETIASAKVSSSAHDAVKKGYLRPSDRIVMNQDYLLDEAKDTVLFLAEGGFRPLLKKPVKVLGTSGRASLQYSIDFMHKGGFITEYDAHIAKMIAWVMTGGDVPAGVLVTEEQILELEKEAFLSLCGESKTLQRIEHMLSTGKPLRN